MTINRPADYMLKAVDIAEHEVGVREVGRNDGPRVREYLKTCGLHPGDPYCGAFVAWCISQACTALGLPYPFPLVHCAYTPSFYHKCLRIYSYSDHVTRGDLFFVYKHSLGRIGHVGFVASSINHTGIFKTIEGNTNAGGSRDGDGVYAARRTNTAKILFARLPQREPSA